MPDNTVVFVTWRLAGTLPAFAREITRVEKEAFNKFVAEDYALDRCASGPHWLKDPVIADMLVEALRYGEAPRKSYELHAWVIMPNHVHVVMQPRRKLDTVMSWFKKSTAVRANALLGRTGQEFWQREYYDHWIRTEKEFADTIRYVEANPVSAGLVESPEDWRWSSACPRSKSAPAP